MRLSGMEIAAATGGVWQHGCPDEIHHVQTDSRNFHPGALFLALRGEHFDGHRFGVSLAGQARALVGDAQGVQLWHDVNIPVLVVEDTLKALGAMARAWRDKLERTQVIGITGSYGKTTVRSMLMHVLCGMGVKVHATDANLNNLIGVPMTLLQTPEDAEVAIIECGISEQGEMARLADILAPDGVLLTGMTAAHAQGLGGVGGVMREKLRLLQALDANGWYALGEGVQVPEALCSDLRAKRIQVAVHWHLQGCEVVFEAQGEQAALVLPLPAKHWCQNMALVLSVLLSVDGSCGYSGQLPELVGKLASWQPVAGRLKTLRGVHGSVLLDDAYNANPASMQAALNTLRATGGRTWVILGDMKELGDEADKLHAGLDIQGITHVLLVGEHMQVLHAQHEQTRWFASVDEVMLWLGEHLDRIRSGDTVLVKGSRSMRLDKVVRMLERKENNDAV